MTDFLLVLAKTNLAISAAILAVMLLRRPVRAIFHAPLAYALWLLVPVAGLASLLPPRVVRIVADPVRAPVPLAAGLSLHTRLAGAAASFDWNGLLFAAWACGALAVLGWMAWAQFQFRQAERRGRAGPAVAGFLRPRLVLPSGFATQFAPCEQAAILAHEQAHLARQDARVNAVMALLRCLCWFNPLVHLGAMALRRDQELACDAAALKHVPRIDYAHALLKSQMPAVALPLGCGWPGSEHPLTERIALLKTPLPGRTRRRIGIAAILALTFCAGFGAWAAQPAQTAPVPQTKGERFAIRVVDESVAENAAQGPAGEDRFRRPNGKGWEWLKREGEIGADVLAEAHASSDNGRPIISFSLTPKGKDEFAQMTRENVGHRLAIVVNGAVLTDPRVMDPILGGQGQISGDFVNEAQAKALAARMMGVGAGYPSDMLTYTGQAAKGGPVLYFTLKADQHKDHKSGMTNLVGNVTMQFPYGMAQADRGTMNEAGRVVLTDNVKLMYGGQIKHGNMLMFEARTGILKLDGDQMPSGMPPQ